MNEKAQGNLSPHRTTCQARWGLRLELLEPD